MQYIKFSLAVLITCLISGTAYVVRNCVNKPTQKLVTSNSIPESTEITFQVTKINARENDYNFFDVILFESGTAWALGAIDEIRYSKDWGKTWVKRNIDPNSAGLNAIYFVDEIHGWAVGGYENVLRTTDGGDSWFSPGYFPKAKDKRGLDRVMFTDLQNGYIATGTEWGCEIYRTNNGGKSWKKVFEDSKSGFVFSLAVPDKTVVIAALNDNYLLRTEDNGKTWNKIDLEAKGASCVTFTKNGIGWVVGRNGSFFYSTDKGRSWARPQKMPSIFLNINWGAIEFSDSKRGIAVGDKGAIAITCDGGNTWSTPKSTLSERLFNVRVKGEKGLILGTDNIYGFVFPNCQK